MKKSILIIVITLLLITGAFLFIKNNDEESQINYEIVTDKSIINEFKTKNKERSYEVVAKDEYYYLVINYGEESSYYSRLEVTDVEINDKNINVTVELPKDEGIGDAFSYPQAVIKLDLKPENININYK